MGMKLPRAHSEAPAPITKGRGRFSVQGSHLQQDEGREGDSPLKANLQVSGGQLSDGLADCLSAERRRRGCECETSSRMSYHPHRGSGHVSLQKSKDAVSS
ncbi:unnamed protein product [Pleuronectes platessa]|uniref:Uncharacterized protein n=1 Tax=Pleuronectes platessa TaxID=8262 RepID=A0A9N7VG06_PLEPL|nr:unnamed protein product [Pleuronectes platessa]